MEPDEIKSKVDLLKTEAPQVDNDEVQVRVQRLIELIKQSLRSQNLTAKTQKELARLLSIAPNLKNHHVQQLDLLDLAVSLLTEANEVSTSPLTDNNSALQREPKNLVFVRETRKQIDRQSRHYPDVLRAMFTGNGTPYIRLISGLSWFGFIFVLLPLLVAGTAVVTREAARDIVQYEEAIAEATRLTAEAAASDAAQANLTSENERLKNQNNALIAGLATTESNLSNLTAQTNDDSENLQSEYAATLDALAEIEKDINAALLDNRALPNSQVSREANSQETKGETNAAGTEVSPSASSTPRANNQNAESEGQTLAQQLRDTSAYAIRNTNDLINNRFSLILLAISMGALGSTISVIVRADTFIQQAQESDNDLFLTGFFRPFVGMSFAIFCVALVETGIFSGIFDIGNREGEDPTYFYVAIAFVAGFSERLVRDVVVKTEDTLAGPKPRD